MVKELLQSHKVTATRSAVLVAVGDPVYRRAADQAVASLATHMPGLNTIVLSGPIPPGLNAAQFSRAVKISLLHRVGADQVMYLDGECLVQEDVSAGFQLLDDGWDLVITPSQNQDGLDLFWHVDRAETDMTLLNLGFAPLQLQGGMWFVRRSPATERLFDAWHAEWDRFRGKDQAALVRALLVNPVRIALLGYPWLLGPVVMHRFGLFGRTG